jgi:hypothetical protein
MFASLLLAMAMSVGIEQELVLKNSDDPTYPLPLYHEREESIQLFFIGSHVLGTGEDSRNGMMCRLPGGKSATLAAGAPEMPFDAHWAFPIIRDDNYLAKIILGTACGVIGELYLGNGASAVIDLRGPLPSCRAGIAWWPIEGSCLSLNFDLVRGRLEYGWEGDNHPIGAIENCIAAVAFALAMSTGWPE